MYRTVVLKGKETFFLILFSLVLFSVLPSHKMRISATENHWMRLKLSNSYELMFSHA